MWYKTKLLCGLLLLCSIISACDSFDSRDATDADDSSDFPPPDSSAPGDVSFSQDLLPTQITSMFRLDQQEVWGPCPHIRRPDFLVSEGQQYLVSAVSNPRSILVFNTETGDIEKRSILPDSASLLASFHSADKLVLFYYNAAKDAYGLAAMNGSGETVFAVDLPDFGADLEEVIQNRQGEYLLLFAQSGFSGNAGDRNHLVAITETGQVAWSRPVLHSLDTAYPTAVDFVLREDRSVVVAGYSNYPHGAGVLESYSSSGDLDWQKQYVARKPNTHSLSYLQALRDGHVLVVGESAAVPGHAWLFEIDPQGVVVWDSEELWNEQDKHEGFGIINRAFSSEPLLFRETQSDIRIITPGPWDSNVSYRTYILDRSGNLMRTYDWPLHFQDGDKSCRIGQFETNSQSELILVANCENMLSHSGECQGARQTSIFELE